jgi:hypothetical protein
MKSHVYRALVTVGAVALASCGGSSPEQKAAQEMEKAAQQLEKAAEGTGQGAQDLAKGFEAMAKGLAAATGAATGDTKPVDPVSFRELQTVMADISGWERTNPTGERMTSPFSFSQASVTYKKGDVTVEQKIMDSGFNQLLFAPFTMFMVAGYEKETQDGFERSVNIDGNPGWEKWDKGNRSGELAVVVNKRFLVQVEGNRVDDVKTLREILDRTDLKKLAALK